MPIRDGVRTMSSEQRKPPVSLVSRVSLGSRLGGFIREWRPDRNPLRRASDRVETVALAALLITFLAGVPFVALACGTIAHAIGHRAQLAELSARHQVTAVVLNTAAQEYGDGGLVMPQVKARWSMPGGKAVTGEVTVPAGTTAGAKIPVWVTRDGQLTDPPLQDSQIAGQAFLAQTFGVITFTTVLVIAGALIRRGLGKRRMAGWDADWMATGPRWTPRS